MSTGPPHTLQQAIPRAHARPSSARLYDSLETAASLPGSGVCLSRFNASLLRKSRPSRGLNVGVVYLTKTHLVFFAHFVVASPADKRVSLPLRNISTVKKTWYGRLFPNGVLLRWKGGPDYLVVLADKEKQREVAARVNAMVAEAKELQSESSTSTDDAVKEAPAVSAPDLEGHQPVAERVSIRTMRRMRSVKFAQTQKRSRGQPRGKKVQQIETPHETPREAKTELETTKMWEPETTKISDTLKETRTEQHPEMSVAAQPTAYDESCLAPHYCSHSLQGTVTSVITSIQKNVETDRQQESLVFCVSAFILMFTTIGVCVALYLLQLRISVIGSHLAAQH